MLKLDESNLQQNNFTKDIYEEINKLKTGKFYFIQLVTCFHFNYVKQQSETTS
jgi:hypothetical protein